MTLNEFKKEYKRDILVRVIQALKLGTMTRKEAKIFAKNIISIYQLPDSRILVALSKLSQVGAEFVEFYLKLAANYTAAHDYDLISQTRAELNQSSSADYLADIRVTNFHSVQKVTLTGGEN